jgi:membrane protein YqaA with SNARE-associated domain
MKKIYKRILYFSCLILVVISISVGLYIIGPEQIVAKIGVNNAYILIFFMALFAGFSAWTSTVFLIALVSLALGGINPFGLGLIAGIGLSIGDIFMFFVASRGRKIIGGKWDKRIKKFSKKIKHKNSKWIAFLSYVYIGLTPFPNDFLIIFLGIIEYPIKKIYPVIILGDLTFTGLVAVLASKGILLFI